MSKFFGYILLIAGLLVSCNSRKEACEQLSAGWRSEDKSIENLDYLYQLAQKNPNCLDSLIDPELVMDNGFLNRDKFEKHYFGETIDTVNQKIKINILLENSKSMWGYFSGQTDCKITLAKTIIHSGYLFGKENLDFYFITDSARKQNLYGQVTEFLSRLEPKDLNTGNVKNTRIADIVKTTINQTDDDEVSILISDCIYSPGRGKNFEESINFEWALIEESFLSRLHNSDISVSIHKYLSNFKGYYYYIDPEKGNEPGKFLGKDERYERPYYIISIGETKLLKAMLDEIDFKSYPGYQNSYFITLPQKSGRIDYSILNTYKIGSFRPDRSNPRIAIESARKGSRGPEDGVFQYTIAANLKDINAEDDYLTDPSKYQVSGNYVLQVNEITPEDIQSDPYLEKFTHLLSLRKTGDMRNETVKVSLKRETPAWIYNTHTNQDHLFSAEYQKKTRGFENLIDGIESAFYQAQKKKLKDDNSLKYHFTLTTQVSL